MDPDDNAAVLLSLLRPIIKFEVLAELEVERLERENANVLRENARLRSRVTALEAAHQPWPPRD